MKELKGFILLYVDTIKQYYMFVHHDCKTLAYVNHFNKLCLFVLLLYYVSVCATFFAYVQ